MHSDRLAPIVPARSFPVLGQKVGQFPCGISLNISAKRGKFLDIGVLVLLGPHGDQISFALKFRYIQYSAVTLRVTYDNFRPDRNTLIGGDIQNNHFQIIHINHAAKVLFDRPVNPGDPVIRWIL